MRVRFRRGVWALGIVALLGFALLVAVFALELSYARPPHPGFADSNARWIMYGADFPAFLYQTKSSPAGDRLLDAIPSVARFFRLVPETALRLEPAWWRVWLGRQFLFSQSDGEWGACFYPGAALRLASFLGWGGEGSWNGLRFAWREGFLLVSASKTHLDKMLAMPACEETPLVSVAETLQIRGGWDELGGSFVQKVELTIWPNWAMEGRAMLDTVFRGGGTLILPDAWRNAPLGVLASANASDLQNLLNGIVRVSVRSMRLERMSASPSVKLLETLWENLTKIGTQETALLCDSIDFGTPIPTPSLGLVHRQVPGQSLEKSIEPLFQGLARIPYAWGQDTGWQVPVWGPLGTVCVSSRTPCWFFASQEPEMASMLENFQPAAPVIADFALRLNWRAAAPVLLQGLCRAAEWELLEECDQADVLTAWAGFCEALGNLNAAAIDAQAWGGWMQFKGYLGRSAGL